MPIRDLVVTGIIFGLLPVCFARPWIGALVWAWIGYMNPHRLVWGFAYHMPFAQLVAFATIAGWLFTKDRAPLPRIREVYLLLALWGVFSLSTWQALYPEAAWDQFVKVSKILFMTFVSLLLLQDAKKLRALIWVIVLSLGFYGLKGGFWAVLTGGQYIFTGPPGSFIEGNTSMGLALNMVLPLLLFLRREETRPWMRYLLLTMLGGSIICILITYSRGAFLGLAAVFTLLLLKSRNIFLASLVMAAIVLIASLTLPEQWYGRMETIQTYEEDRSAMSRIKAWQVSYRLALDHPVLGGGFEPYTPEVYQKYLPDDEMVIHTGAHSIFFQVLGEHGFTGLALYAGLILSTWLSLRGVIQRSQREPSLQWIANCAHMLEVSLLGFVMSGLFLSMCYFDLFYHLVAIVILLKQLLLVQEQDAVQVSGDGGMQRSLLRSSKPMPVPMA